MAAFRLAERCGIVDPEAMRDAMEPELLMQWQRFRNAGGDDLYRIVEILKRGFALVAASWSGKYPDLDQIDPWHEDAAAEDTPENREAMGL